MECVIIPPLSIFFLLNSFMELFEVADFTFRHQIVYDPLLKRRCPLTPFDPATAEKARVSLSSRSVV